ncbi:MAG: IgGFc-binding protein [Prevotella sp.]|jgi:hypothetical protein|nr:IgGFc-binding protein [Prevotella sp.]
MKQKILILFTLFFITSVIKAQDTEFWFTAPHSSHTVVSGYQLYRPMFLAISNTNAQPANIQITLYNGGSTITITDVIPANGFYKKDFTTINEANQIQNPREQAGNVVKYGIHISSDIKVTAYYMANHPASKDIYTLKGGNALGTEFYVPMQHDQYYPNQAANYAAAADQIDIVATEDGTIVTVMPKTVIRVGPSSSAPGNTAYVKTLNKGETLKIMEHTPTGGTLAGSHITSTKPIAVTVTEDMVNGDISGDQIVPIRSLGKRYIVARGYMTTTAADRVYFVGTVDNTTLTIYNGGTNIATTINAGESYVYNFSQSPTEYAISVEANNPIYVYQRTGYGEQGAALLPSMYSISQDKVSYFQVSAQQEKGILVYREGAESGFTISYGSTTSALSITPLSVPNVTGWKCARIDLPAAANNQVVRISNSKGYFSFGYIAANETGDKNTNYGYLSAFDFQFPNDTIYKCPDATVTLEGGYALSYQWEHATTKDGPYITLSETGYSITVSDEGYYKLTMDQDPKTVMDTVFVKNIDFQASISAVTTSGTTAFSSSINQDIIDDPNLTLSYYWEFDGGTPATSTDENPVVTWSGKTLTAKLTITAEANSANSTGGCSTTVYAYLIAGQEVCMGKAEAIDASSFTLPDGSTPTSYQWQSSKDNAIWANIAENGTGSSYNISPQRRGVTYYRVVVTSDTSEKVESASSRIRVMSCKLPVNHNISAMEYYD